MKKLALIALLSLMLGSSLVNAQPYENSSVVGQVQDRVVITVTAGTKMTFEKSGDVVRVGVPSLDALSERFAVKDMEQMYAGMTTNMKSKSDKDLLSRVWAVDFPAEMGLKAVQAAYAALPEVQDVRLVDICKMYDAYLPNDVASAQYYLRNMNLGGGDLRAVGAWNQALGDSNIIVAVGDSGVDWHHPDLGGPHPDKVNGALWTNWEEYNGIANYDDDGNGKIDDIRGWDFVNMPASEGWPDEDVTGADNDPMDYESHGTMCAGCVTAITGNGIGIAGTAPGVKVMAIRVGWLPNGETGGLVRMDFAAQGIVYAMDNGAKIFNASWGSSIYLSNAVTSAQNAGMLIITAAGNDNNDEASWLGTRSGVIAVAATDQNDVRASFSCFGAWVEIAAPGVGIYSTHYNRFTQSSGYASWDGTSFASPITAGAAALLWSANPTMSYQEITGLLMHNADNIDELNPGYAGLLGAGRVNMLRALGDTEHRYPEEFPTIFDAINSAADGDIIAIEGGITVDGPITVLGREVQVLGGYSSDYTSRDPINNPTTVQGVINNSVLKFYGDVENTTVVDGFLLTGGGGLNFSGIPYSGIYGGGVQLHNVSPTLRNLEITGNSVGSTSVLGLGGGMMINNSHAVLENINIHGNTGIYGAGVFINNSTPTMTDCIIEGNTVITDNMSYTPHGGGMHLVNSTVTMTDCSVSNHTDCDQGGGIYSSDASLLNMTGGEITNNDAVNNGGGIYHNGGSLNLVGVTISENSNLPASTFMNGGGIFAEAASVNLDSLVVEANTANAGGGVSLNTCTQADVSNSVFLGNSGQFFGGAIHFNNNTAGTLSGNTIVENDATFSGGAGIYVQGSFVPDMSNNLIAFNTGGTSFGNGVAVPSAPAEYLCNDVFSNANSDYSGMADPTGTGGNISADPLFCNQGTGNLNLESGSPCSADGSGGCGLIGALGGDCSGGPPSGVDDDEGNIPVAFRVEQNFPNPFNPSTTIRFALPSAAHTRVVIFDLAGRKVKTLVDGMLTAQNHEAVWTGKDEGGRAVSAGVYFYRVSSGEHLSVGRMALIK